MAVAEIIEQKLKAAFDPVRLVVTDDSHKHAGHVGARPEGETHFTVEVISDAFAGQNRVARQRMVNKVLADELAGPVHALAMKTLTPDEA